MAAGDAPKLIRCGDHKYAPWSVVCVHLATGASDQWRRIPGEDGNQDDWLCPGCEARGLDNLKVESLKAICIHCVRQMQQVSEGRRKTSK